MKMFLRKKVRQMLLLIVQTPHKTFMIKYYDNNLKKKLKKKSIIQRVRQHSEQLYIM